MTPYPTLTPTPADWIWIRMALVRMAIAARLGR